MQNHYQSYFNITSSHKKRRKNDMQFQFSYFNWLQDAPESSVVDIDTAKYKHQLVWGREPKGPVSIITYTNNMNKNLNLQKQHLMKTNIKVRIQSKKIFVSCVVILENIEVLIARYKHTMSTNFVEPFIFFSFFVSMTMWTTEVRMQCWSTDNYKTFIRNFFQINRLLKFK